MVDVNKVTPTQEFIIARHSKMVGKVLDLVEASLPEGNQCDKLKSLYKFLYMILEMKCLP